MKRREIGRAVRAYLVQERELRAEAKRGAGQEAVHATSPPPPAPHRQTLTMAGAVGVRTAAESA